MSSERAPLRVVIDDGMGEADELLGLVRAHGDGTGRRPESHRPYPTAVGEHLVVEVLVGQQSAIAFRQLRACNSATASASVVATVR